MGDWSPKRVPPPRALLRGDGPWCLWTRTRSGGPTRRLCTLTEPNEEMAPEALMAVWFSFTENKKSRHRFDTGGARRPAIPRTKNP